jgi:hypothetical protein
VDYFIAVDRESILSYEREKEYAKVASQFDKHVLLVEAGFDPKNPTYFPKKSQIYRGEVPPYQGQVRVLGSLVWSDVFAFLASEAQFLADLWSLAVMHPSHVYVGPIVKSQEMEYNDRRQMESLMIEAFYAHLRKKTGA